MSHRRKHETPAHRKERERQRMRARAKRHATHAIRREQAMSSVRVGLTLWPRDLPVRGRANVKKSWVRMILSAIGGSQ